MQGFYCQIGPFIKNKRNSKPHKEVNISVSLGFHLTPLIYLRKSKKCSFSNVSPFGIKAARWYWMQACECHAHCHRKNECLLLKMSWSPQSLPHLLGFHVLEAWCLTSKGLNPSIETFKCSSWKERCGERWTLLIIL